MFLLVRIVVMNLKKMMNEEECLIVEEQLINENLQKNRKHYVNNDSKSFVYKLLKKLR